MEEITIKVPGERLAEFYEMYGRWLASAPASLGQEKGSSYAEWSKGDLAEAKEVWGKLSEVARQLFELLMAEPGRKLSGEEIATELGFKKGGSQTAGTLAWPGRYAYALGKKHPVCFEEVPSGGSLYWMAPLVAELFEKARTALRQK